MCFLPPALSLLSVKEWCWKIPYSGIYLKRVIYSPATGLWDHGGLCRQWTPLKCAFPCFLLHSCKNVAPEGASDGQLRLAGGSGGRNPFPCAGEAILTCSGDTVQKSIKPRPARVLAWLPYQLKPGFGDLGWSCFCRWISIFSWQRTIF